MIIRPIHTLWFIGLSVTIDCLKRWRLRMADFVDLEIHNLKSEMTMAQTNDEKNVV